MRTFKTTRVFVPASAPKPPPPPRKKPTSPGVPKVAAPEAQAPAPRPPAPAREHAPVKAAQPTPPAPPGPEPTPPGAGYLLEIDRAAIVELQKLGRTVEVRFVVMAGPHAGSLARGQFPVSGMGLPILSDAALGSKMDFSAPEHAASLIGKRVVADVVQPSNRLSLVRNIRAATA